MKLAIVTRSDHNVREMANLTHPYLETYAEACDADLIILSHKPSVLIQGWAPHFRDHRVVDILDCYDRIALMDHDIIIMPHCPNIFKVVPEDCIAAVCEDKGSRQADRRKRLMDIQRVWGDVGMTEGYGNFSISVSSRMHKNAWGQFKDQPNWMGPGNGDVQVNYAVRYYKMKFMELPFTWNHMSMFSEEWNGNADRFKSNIIHYAGAGAFPDKGNRTKPQLCRDDIAKVFGGKHA